MRFLTSVLTFLAIACCPSAEDDALEKPSFLKICHRSQSDLNDCIKQSIEALRPYLKSGIPELGLAPSEPLYIPEVTMNQAAGPVSIQSVYQDLTINGVTDFILKSIRVDPDIKLIRIRCGFPLLRIHSTYNIDGRILLLPITASGEANSNISDIQAIATVQCDHYKNDKTGKTHLRMNDMYIDFAIGNCHTELKDSSGRDQILANAMNLFLNDNWQIAAAELKPVCENLATDMLRNITNVIFTKYPLDVLLPP